MLAYRSAVKAALAASAVLASSLAFAHPKLLSSTPADQAEVSAPPRIELHFSEGLVTRFSGANLVMTGMTGMPGMAGHGPMKVTVTVSGSDDPRMMVITPAKPLVPGTYRVDWHAVSSDTHRVGGNFSFTVK